MTTLTRCHHMQANQWKCGEAVIKPDIVTPGNFIVTVSAILPEGSLMNILLFMAINACQRKLCGERAMMTVLAGGICVLSKKWKPGVFCMIELRSLPPINCMA